jgi:hypothetical protein
MSLIARTATGRLYGLDDFSTPPYDVLTNNWTSFYGTVTIESGELSVAASNGRTDGQLRTKATYLDQVVCARFKRDTSTLVRFFLRYYTAPGEYAYVVGFEATRAVLKKVVNGTWTEFLYPAITCDAATWYNVKIQVTGSPTTFKVWFNDSLIGTVADDPDTPTAGRGILLAYHATADTAHSHFDNVAVSSANTISCSNLPTGWKLRVAENDTYKATGSGGTATVALAGLTLPVSKVEVLDGSDVLRATYTSTNDVWGGDAYKWAPFTKTAKPDTPWTKASKDQTPWTPS